MGRRSSAIDGIVVFHSPHEMHEMHEQAGGMIFEYRELWDAEDEIKAIDYG